MQIKNVTNLHSPCDALSQYRMFHDTIVVTCHKLGQDPFDFLFFARFIRRSRHFRFVLEAERTRGGREGMKLHWYPVFL